MFDGDLFMEGDEMQTLAVIIGAFLIAILVEKLEKWREKRNDTRREDESDTVGW